KHITGQEAEALPRLHRRPGEDDAVDLFGLQCLNGKRDREVALARTGRPYRERDGAVAHRVDEALLSRRLGPDRLATAQHFRREHLTRPLFGLQPIDRATHTLTVEVMTLLEQHLHLLEEL